MDITLKVYEEDMATVKKECKAEMVKIPFGTIRKLMQLFNVDNIDDTSAIMGIVMTSWTNVISILDKVFPEVSEEDWDTVDTKELIQVVYQLLKNVAVEFMSIPTDPKN